MNRDQIAAIVREAEARATRAEAHAERLAEIVRDMFETWDVRVALTRTGTHAALIDRIRAALSAYRGVKDEA